MYLIVMLTHGISSLSKEIHEYVQKIETSAQDTHTAIQGLEASVQKTNQLLQDGSTAQEARNKGEKARIACEKSDLRS